MKEREDQDIPIRQNRVHLDPKHLFHEEKAGYIPEWKHFQNKHHHDSFPRKTADYNDYSVNQYKSTIT